MKYLAIIIALLSFNAIADYSTSTMSNSTYTTKKKKIIKSKKIIRKTTNKKNKNSSYIIINGSKTRGSNKWAKDIKLEIPIDIKLPKIEIDATGKNSRFTAPESPQAPDAPEEPTLDNQSRQ